jgi:hypothetical protein
VIGVFLRCLYHDPDAYIIGRMVGISGAGVEDLHVGASNALLAGRSITMASHECRKTAERQRGRTRPLRKPWLSYFTKAIETMMLAQGVDRENGFEPQRHNGKAGRR